MHESDTPSASSSPVNEPTTTEMYSDKGGLYNYRLFPKTDETVAAYFNLPEVSAFLDELAKIPTPITVLDIGSGVGVEAAFLRHLLPNASITSLELSTVGAQFAKKTLTSTKCKRRPSDYHLLMLVSLHSTRKIC